MKEGDKMNIAFKCNYCDGGKDENRLGFAGVCSIENIEYNINRRNYTQCRSDTHSKCRKYLQGECTYQEVVAACPVCYESALLTDWRFGAGYNLNGENAGRARHFRNVSPGRVAVLTTRLPEQKEKNRLIFAIFMIGEHEIGDANDASYVKANQWKIELTPSEAQQMQFWDYYHGNRDGNIRWNQGIRYLTDDEIEKILTGIIKIKEKTDEKEFAEKFLKEFKNTRGE